jgi:hypothetical protein
MLIAAQDMDIIQNYKIKSKIIKETSADCCCKVLDSRIYCIYSMIHMMLRHKWWLGEYEEETNG